MAESSRSGSLNGPKIITDDGHTGSGLIKPAPGGSTSKMSGSGTASGLNIKEGSAGKMSATGSGVIGLAKEGSATKTSVGGSGIGLGLSSEAGSMHGSSAGKLGSGFGVVTGGSGLGLIHNVVSDTLKKGSSGNSLIMKGNSPDVSMTKTVQIKSESSSETLLTDNVADEEGDAGQVEAVDSSAKFAFQEPEIIAVDETKGVGLMKKQSKEYIEKHKLLELFNNMTGLLVFYRPDDSKLFMVEQLEKLQAGRKTMKDLPCLWNEENIETLFDIFDPTNRGHLPLTKYHKAMQAIGAIEYDMYPMVADEITKEVFVAEAMHGLSRAAATFAEPDIPPAQNVPSSTNAKLNKHSAQFSKSSGGSSHKSSQLR